MNEILSKNIIKQHEIMIQNKKPISCSYYISHILQNINQALESTFIKYILYYYLFKFGYRIVKIFFVKTKIIETLKY